MRSKNVNERAHRRGGSFNGPFLILPVVLILCFGVAAQDDEEEDLISPTRPGVSESVGVPKKGVVQLEYGGEFDFRSPEFKNEQSGPSGVFLGAHKRLRLDFEFTTFISQRNRMEMRETGIGDVSLGFKAIFRDKPKERLGVGMSYSVKLPAASEEKGLGTGRVDHNIRLILNRTYGDNDFTFNLSYLDVGRDDSERRASGGQFVFSYERKLPRKFSVIAETWGNSVDERQPRGIYVLGAVTYKVSRRVRVDGGFRPGFGSHAPKFNAFAGLALGIGG
ncbi:MAG: transporter [Pyrinomonadaceae bacterium]